MNGQDLARARTSRGVSRVEFAQRLGASWLELRLVEVGDQPVPADWDVAAALSQGGPKHTTNEPSRHALAAARGSVQGHLAQE